MSTLGNTGVRSLCHSLKMLCQMCGREGFHTLQRQPVHQMATAAAIVRDNTESFQTKVPKRADDCDSVISRSVTSGAGMHSPKRKPEAPQFCCMNGCANCVWIEYAAELTDYFKDGGKAALEELEKIEDPSLKMILKLQLDIAS